MTRARIVGALLLALAGAALVHAAAPPPVQRLEYTVTPRDEALHKVDITVSARGVAADARWDTGMSVGDAHLTRPQLQRAAAGDVVSVRYSVGLRAMAEAMGDVDTADVVQGGILFNDNAVFLRPDDLKDDAQVTVTVEGALPVHAAWEPVGARTWRMDGVRLDGGTYVLMAPGTRLHTTLKGGVLEAVAIGDVDDAQAHRFGAWLSRSAQLVADYNGGVMPVPRTHIILHTTPMLTTAGMYGTTLRWGHGSIVLYVGARATDAALLEDWVAPHELYHLANPVLTRRVSWFIEGMTTYYQEVLRARGGLRQPNDTWRALMEGAADSCGTAQADSLLQASEKLRRTRAYQRVYWGGACVGLVLDVLLRSQGGSTQGGSLQGGAGASLDALLKDLRSQSLKEPLDADALEKMLVESLPAGWARAWVVAALRDPAALPLAQLWERLGLAADGTTDDTAPWAHVRRGIMGQPAPPKDVVRRDIGPPVLRRSNRP